MATSSPSLAELPSEVLVQVLCLLPLRDSCQAARACRALRAAAERALGCSPFLDLKAGSAVLGPNCFARLCSKTALGRLHRLELDCWHLTDSCLEQLPQSIREIALSGCDHHSDALLQGVVRRLAPHLTRFAFSGFGGSLSESPFASLAQSCRGLVSFALDSGRSIDTNRVVCAVAASCPKLKELCTHDLTQETLWQLLMCGVRLRCLRLKCRHLGYVTVTDSALGVILSLCPDMEELQIIDKTEGVPFLGFSDVGLLSLVSRAPTLRTLHLRLPHPAPPTQCSEVALMQMANACTSLTSLELANLRCLSDPALYEFIHRCPGLTEVGVPGSCITDASLDSLALHCPRLRTLSISSCRKVTDVGIRALSRLPHLQSLGAGVLHRLTDSAVADLCSASTGMTSLVLNQSLLSDAALSAIGGCSLLEELALHGCSNVTNAGVKLVAGGCPRLRYVSLSFCERISDAGVIALANSCQHLLKLRLDGCRHLSNPCVRELCMPAWTREAASEDVRPGQHSCQQGDDEVPGQQGDQAPGQQQVKKRRKKKGREATRVDSSLGRPLPEEDGQRQQEKLWPGTAGEADGQRQQEGIWPVAAGEADGPEQTLSTEPWFTSEGIVSAPVEEPLGHEACFESTQNKEDVASAPEEEPQKQEACRGLAVSPGVSLAPGEEEGSESTGAPAVPVPWTAPDDNRNAFAAIGTAPGQARGRTEPPERCLPGAASAACALKAKRGWALSPLPGSDREQTDSPMSMGAWQGAMSSCQDGGNGKGKHRGKDEDRGKDTGKSCNSTVVPGTCGGGASATLISVGTREQPPVCASRLRYLSMQGCTKLSDHIFTYLAHAQNLRFLDLPRGKITSAALAAFSENRPHVELCVDGTPF